MDIRDCTDSASLAGVLDSAALAVSQGRLLVLPTDTVYGVGADAFNPAAVANLLAAKGRDRQMPPPVLVGTKETAQALAAEISEPVRALIDRFWPGALTIIVGSQPSLAWDLGETQGTVALRMPDSEQALELLQRTGPLAVSSANKTGMPAATTAQAAADMLGESVSLYLDAGESGGGVSSTIVDATALPIRIVREGGISREQLAEVVELEAPEDEVTSEP